jgi:hypothetical protein
MNEVDIANPTPGGLWDLLVNAGAVGYALAWISTQIPNEDEVDNPVLKVICKLFNVVAANFFKNKNVST